MMEELYWDYILVPSGVFVVGIYHVWLLFTIIRYPTRTVIGLNTICRHRWVVLMMSDLQRNGVLGVQTLRNNLMASTLLATISITLSSLITAFVSSSNQPIPITYTIDNIKYFSVLVCFLAAFFCNVQCTRYYAHCSFLLNVPSPQGRDEFVDYVYQTLNKGCFFWSLGLRAFYFSFPLLLWIFGPVPMFACSCSMAFTLYFLDTACPASWNLPEGYYAHDREPKAHYAESLADSIDTAPSGEYHLFCSLLGGTRPGSTVDIAI